MIFFRKKPAPLPPAITIVAQPVVINPVDPTVAHAAWRLGHLQRWFIQELAEGRDVPAAKRKILEAEMVVLQGQIDLAKSKG